MFTREQGGGNRSKLPGIQADFPVTAPAYAPSPCQARSLGPLAPVQLPTRQRLPLPRSLCGGGEQSQLRPGTAPERDDGCHSCRSQSQQVGSHLKLLTGVSRPSQSTFWPTSSTHTVPCCSGASPLWREGCHCHGQGECALVGQSQLKPGTASEQGTESHCWHSQRQHSRSSLDLTD